jgi:hypothetical protein
VREKKREGKRCVVWTCVVWFVLCSTLLNSSGLAQPYNHGLLDYPCIHANSHFCGRKFALKALAGIPLNMDGDDLRVKAASAVADAIKLDMTGKSEAAASSYDIASSALHELLNSGVVTDADRDSIERVRKALEELRPRSTTMSLGTRNPDGGTQDPMKPSDHLTNALLTDMYQITMAYAYFRTKRHNTNAVFDLFFRKNPFDGEYTIFAGLSEVIAFLNSYKFTEQHLAFLKVAHRTTSFACAHITCTHASSFAASD